MKLEKIIENAKKARKNVLRLACNAGSNGAHIAPSLSVIEIVTSVYACEIGSKDSFILSKGHGALGYYCVLETYGIIPSDVLDTFEHNGGLLPGQPAYNKELGIMYSSGSLGLGLPFAAGLAMAKKQKNESGRVYALVGDGECNEGSIWEAAMFAAHKNLDNLCVIVDNNGMQSDGKTAEILNVDLSKIFESFGFKTVTVDGHNITALTEALQEKTNKPYAVIANTVKGKGISFMENNNEWHHNVLQQAICEKALEELK